jgi:hypothetical protein
VECRKAENGGAQNDIAASLSWMGVSSIKRLGFGLMEGVIWNELSAKRRDKIITKVKRFAKKFIGIKPAGKSLKIKLMFFVTKQIHKTILKNESTPGADSRYLIARGWLKGENNNASN